MKIISVISGKGGVGKSTIAKNLGDVLSVNYKVCYATSDANKTILEAIDGDYFNEISYIKNFDKECDYLIIDTSDDFQKSMLNLSIVMESHACVYVTQVEKPSLKAFFGLYENVFSPIDIQDKIKAVVANHHLGFKEHVANYSNLLSYCNKIKVPLIGPLYFRKDIGATLWDKINISDHIELEEDQKPTTLNKFASKMSDLSSIVQ